MSMEVDIRKHLSVRKDVSAGLAALRVQSRQIWGDTRHSLDEIAVRLMVGVGDIARATRDGGLRRSDDSVDDVTRGLELKKELGNVIFSMVRWIDDLGLDPLECLDLAIGAQERFARSKRPR